MGDLDPIDGSNFTQVDRTDRCALADSCIHIKPDANADPTRIRTSGGFYPLTGRDI